jgi:hypothetical protein
MTEMPGTRHRGALIWRWDEEWPAIDEHVGLWTLLGVSEEDVMEAVGFEVDRNSVRT